MTTLAGAGALARMAIRRDRIMLPIWLYAFAAFIGATVYGFRGLYPTAPGRAEFAATANHNSALLSIYGPFYGSSIGSFTAWRDTVICALLAGLMSVFIVIRHTRADEEAGRGELIGSAAVGRHAALAGALIVAIAADLVAGAVLAAVAIVLGLPAAGSIALAAGIAACGLVFAAAAAVAAQLARAARTARGLAVTALGVAFLLRAVGDSVGAGGPRWLSWLSPIGWAELIRPFGAVGGPRWWVLVLPVVLATLAAVLAGLLAARRDYDAGIWAQRAGPATAARWLGSPLALAWRLQRATAASWLAGALVYGVVLGSASHGIQGLFGTAQVRRIVLEMGGAHGLTDAFLAAVMSMTGLAVGGYAISAVLRLRSEEAGTRAEMELAAGAGRLGWALSHLVIATAGVLAILAITGLGVAVGLGTGSGTAGGAGTAEMVGAALAQAPAALVLGGLAAALFGLAPRAAITGAWSALGFTAAVLFLGPTLRLPSWLLDVSPFTHAPRLPGGGVSAAPLLWLGLAAVALACLGLFGVRRRDIG
jgi:ABC-2 type transport system permease protein